ncbi:MAG: 30S ribosomal protein S17 [Acholeplasmatales bacterium]|nr:30S ribosomal protein S17 [Acholeplasmatales bacterium]
MEERNRRKVFTGTVVSTKMEKTITVNVDTFKVNRLYNKRVKQSKKYHVDDSEGLAKEGDVVTIMETRPLSKTKKFRLLAVVKAAADE